MKEVTKSTKDKTTNNISRAGTSERQSNIELYRIIVMFLIVAHHYVVNSGLMDAGGPILTDPLSWRSLFLLLWGAWGKTGINCFMLIGGYFMCKSQITVKKYLKLLGAFMFYRAIFNSIFWITGYTSFDLKAIVKFILPITSIGTGFTSAYLVFFLYIPFLNILISHLTEKQHILLILLCSFVYILLGTVHRVVMNYVTWFCVLYCIAAYIRLYPKQVFANVKFWGWATVVCLIISACSVIACAWLGTKVNKDIAYYFVQDSNTLLAVLTGASSFLFFKNLKMRQYKLINTIAASTFGVLLIHANSDAMRRYLWQDVLNNVGVYHSAWMPVHAIGSVVLIFVGCTAIDYLRIRWIEVPLFKLWNKHENKIFEKYRNVESSICTRFHISQN